ncbi:unknown [Clostridium sp. CAG:1000]|jgi:hypothetical protein|nr:unknown [Clostridium sp. CAG:1000]
MRIIDTGITKEILSGDNQPQLKIGDKLYTVDNRQKTFDKIQKVQSNVELSEEEKTNQIYELALGKENALEVINLDLPVESSIYLSFCIMGAITGDDPKELQRIAKEQARKN